MRPVELFRMLLEQASGKLEAGEASDGERQAKAISALIRAERDVAEFLSSPAPPSEEEDDYARRAELRRRLAAFVEADLAGAPPEVLERIALKGLRH
jgi:hypothetical protein